MVEEHEDVLQVAVATLRDRCLSLEARITELERENLRLSGGAPQVSSSDSKTDLSVQNAHLQTKCRIILKENDELWTRLAALAPEHQVLDPKTLRLSPPPNPHSALIRSKTFTQVEPQTRFLQKTLPEVELDLEDVSLKLPDSLQPPAEEVTPDLEVIAGEMDGIKKEVVQQKSILGEQIRLLELILEGHRRRSLTKDQSTETIQEIHSEDANVCPVCSAVFADFDEVQGHVLGHFTEEASSSGSNDWIVA